MTSNPHHGGSGSAGNGGRSAGNIVLTGVSCFPIAAWPGWSEIYTQCASPNHTLARMTNISNSSGWDVVLVFQVPPGEELRWSISPPYGGSEPISTVMEKVFPRPLQPGYALVPPGSTLTSESVNGTPVHLVFRIDYPATAEEVTTAELVGIVQDEINPLGAEEQAIANCALAVNNLPEQINQWRPSSPDFWATVANLPACYHAFHTAAAAISKDDETTVIDDAADGTRGFFEDLLSKLSLLGVEDIFH
ncbi:MAG TPA: hypothetical protein VME19_11620 [Streptosporangiaceae bacterium]|nr:hypothetical protein [Streptosporangiaceae bacterium]